MPPRATLYELILRDLRDPRLPKLRRLRLNRRLLRNLAIGEGFII